MESHKTDLNSSTNDSTKAKAQSGDWECGQWWTRWVCQQFTDEDGNVFFDYDNCIEIGPFCAYYVYVEEDDPGGGGDGYPGDDPGECDPAGTEPCFDGGGGSIPPPPEPDPCEEDNPPAYCECEDTGNSVLDNTVLQIISEHLWDKQTSSQEEQGGFLYKNVFGDWQFFELEGDWVKKRTLTRLEFYVPSNLPEGSIYIHTHPSQSSLTRFGITNKYQHKPSEDDSGAMVQISSNHGVAYGVIVDPVYRILVGPDGNEITRTTRCGY